MGSNAHVFGGFNFCYDLCRPGGLGVSRESYDIKPQSARRYVQYQTNLLPMDRWWQRTTEPAPMPAPKPTNRTESPEPIDSSPISRDRLGTNSTTHPASTPHHPQSQQHAPVFFLPAIPKTGDDDNDDPILLLLQQQQQQQPFNLPPPLPPRHRSEHHNAVPRPFVLSFRRNAIRQTMVSLPRCLARIHVCVSTYGYTAPGVSRTCRRVFAGRRLENGSWNDACAAYIRGGGRPRRIYTPSKPSILTKKQAKKKKKHE